MKQNEVKRDPFIGVSEVNRNSRGYQKFIGNSPTVLNSNGFFSSGDFVKEEQKIPPKSTIIWTSGDSKNALQNIRI